MALSLGYIKEVTGGELVRGAEQMPITGIATDSRQVESGEIFFALAGENFDGHDYVEKAFAQGATAAVVSHWDHNERYGNHEGLILVTDTIQALQDLAAAWRKKFDLPLIAITGSVGKTTTRDILSTVLSTRWLTLTTQANYNNEIGLPLTLLRLGSGHQAAVVELAMRGSGEIRRLAQITQPTAAVITNVERVHLETLGNLENIAQAKCEILESILDFAVIHGDYPCLAEAAADYTCPRYTFGYNESCDFRLIEVGLRNQKLSIRVRLQQAEADFEFAIPARQLAANVLAAIAVAYLYGFSVDEIKQGLSQYQPTGNRLNITELEQGGILINDTYNANPVSMMAALEVGREIAEGNQFVAILGDMYELGDYEEKGHREVGAKAAQLGVDLLVTIGDKARLISEEAQKCGLSIEHIHHFPVKEDSVIFLRSQISKRDTVLFKASRGMQLEALIDDWLKPD